MAAMRKSAQDVQKFMEAVNKKSGSLDSQRRECEVRGLFVAHKSQFSTSVGWWKLLKCDCPQKGHSDLCHMKASFAKSVWEGMSEHNSHMMGIS